MEPFQPGSIVRIRLHNFLTYEDAEITPGSRLNVVVGPNGSGKSSIMCAIALALGAKPSTLERGDNMKSFVMRAKEKGYVEVELKGEEDGPNHIIRRDLETASNKTSYKYNGKPATREKVEDVVKKLGIQIDNLCTFLPQEKVGKFTELDSIKLLEETEKALTGMDLHAKHMQLIDLQQNSKGHDKDLDALKAEVQKLEDMNKAIERDKERMEERQANLDQVAVLEKCYLYVKLSRLSSQGTAMKKEVEALKKECDKAAQLTQPYRARAEALKVQAAESSAARQKAQTRLAKMKDAMKVGEQACDIGHEDVLRAQAQVDDCDSKRAHKEAELRKQDAELQKAKEQRDKPEAKHAPEKLKEDIATANSQLRQLKTTRDQIYQQMQDAKLELDDICSQIHRKDGQVKELQNVSKQRLERLRNPQNNFGKAAKDAYDLHAWLAKKKQDGALHGRVFGPMCNEISFDNPQIAALVEANVPYIQRFSFVVDTREDRDMILHEFKDRRKAAISVVELSGDWRAQSRRAYSAAELEALKQDGIQGLLVDHIKAAPEIISALCSTSGITDILLADGRTDVEAVMGRLCHGDRSRRNVKVATQGAHLMSHHGKVSEYNGQFSSQTRQVEPARVFGSTNALADAAEASQAIMREIELLQKHELQMRPKFDSLKEEMDKIEQMARKSEETIRTSKKKLREYQGLEQKIVRMEEKVKALQDELSRDASTERGKLKRQVKHAAANLVKTVVAQVNTYDALIQGWAALNAPALTARLATDFHQAAVEEVKRRDEEHKDAEQKLKAANRDFEALKDEIRVLKPKAFATPIQGPKADPKVTPEVQRLKAEGITPEQVLEMIEDKRAAADSIVDNPEVVNQWKQRKADIERKREVVERLEEESNNRLSNMARIQKEWSERLDKVANKLNIQFQNYMRDMNCDGAVVLDKPDGDYSAWALRIRVKFRAENELSDLRARVQSGGERSVSTILFLMALQDLMSSPFRAVDEINQGMDERNERLVFSRIVANSTQVQYFLVTPKLLPRLTSLEMQHVTILFVFNAPQLFHYSEWDVKKLVAKAKSRRDTDDDDGQDTRAQAKRLRAK